MVISEANDSESIIAALVAAGTISDVKTARAWTGAEFKAVAEKASKAPERFAGRHRSISRVFFCIFFTQIGFRKIFYKKMKAAKFWLTGHRPSIGGG
jgi:hypothetical protein